MRWARFAVLILITTVLQAGLVDILAVTRLNIKPDLLLILLVFFAVYCNTTDAIIASFAIGFAADLIGRAIGCQTLSFGFLGTLLAYLHRVIAIRKMLYQSTAIFIVGLLAGILTYFLSLMKGMAAVPQIWAFLFWTSLYSAAVGPFLFLPSAWWMRMKTRGFG